MKLASLNNNTRDGKLLVVSRDLQYAISAQHIAPNLQIALENWQSVEAPLRALSEQLHAMQLNSTRDASFAKPTFMLNFDARACFAPLPRAYAWCDSSTYPSHFERMVRAYSLKMEVDFSQDLPLYQGGSDTFLSGYEDAPFPHETVNGELGIDLEGEIGIITDDVPMGVSLAAAQQHIKLVVLLNDWSLRGIGPNEVKKGFGFFQSKPSTAFAAVAVTPDELVQNTLWHNNRLHATMQIQRNHVALGLLNTGGMHVGFHQLIAHAARTRNLSAGTIIGAGTVSDARESAGVACLAEQRALEVIKQGEAHSAWLQHGETVQLNVLDDQGDSIFGEINQRVSIGVA